MDVINRIGGVVVSSGNVQFQHTVASAATEVLIKVEDKDFEAHFYGEKRTVRWK